jgi:hypothetical protein
MRGRTPICCNEGESKYGVRSISEKFLVKRIEKPGQVADAVIFLMNNGFATGTINSHKLLI